MMYVTYPHRVQKKKVLGVCMCIYEDKRDRETAQMISKHGKNTSKGESGQRVYVSLYYFYFLQFFCKFEFISKKKISLCCIQDGILSSAGLNGSRKSHRGLLTTSLKP